MMVADCNASSLNFSLQFFSGISVAQAEAGATGSAWMKRKEQDHFLGAGSGV
jgi:hypothetical protein